MQIGRQYGDHIISMNAEPDGEGWRVRLPDGSEHWFTVSRPAGDILQIAVADNLPASDFAEPTPVHLFRVPFAHLAEGTAFAFEGETYTFRPPSVRASGRKSVKASGALTAPMSGVVADVLVTVGQTVEARQPLVILEAMKVMTTLEAPFAGTVTSLTVQKKQQIAHGAAVVEITPDTVEKDVSAANERE